MSADNGIYIIKTFRSTRKGNKPVWRVAEIGAIDNYDYYVKNEPHNLGAYIYDNFKNSPVFSCSNDAIGYAFDMNDRVCTEYGVCHLELPDNFVFYNDY